MKKTDYIFKVDEHEFDSFTRFLNTHNVRYNCVGTTELREVTTGRRVREIEIAIRVTKRVFKKICKDLDMIYLYKFDG